MQTNVVLFPAFFLVLLSTTITAEEYPQVKVIPEVKHDTSLALREIIPISSPYVVWEESEEPESEHQPLNNTGVVTIGADSVLQNSVGPSSIFLATTPGLNFDGLSYNGFGSAPPDTNGAAGGTQFVQWVNVQFGVFAKSTGRLVYGPAAGNTPWSGYGGACASTNSGDGIILYDKIAGRWVISRHAKNSSGTWFQCLAVSKTSDATGEYYRYAFQLPTSSFPDYPKLGVWPDGYYLSMNLLNPSNFSFIGALVCALQRSKMLIGASAAMQCFQLGSTYGLTLLPADLDGSLLSPSGSPNYLMNLGTNVLRLWRFHVDFQTPSNSSLTGPTNISVASFAPACGTSGVCIPQPKTSQLLDSLSEEGLMYRLAYRNFGTYQSLVVTHSIGSPSAIRWYEVRNPGGTPTIFQQGTYRPDSNYRWVGSASMDKVGDIALGYSVSGNNLNPGIRITGRVPSDPLGTLQQETTVVAGSGSQRKRARWGDYTSMSIDPVDDCTFWYTNQYLKSSGTNNWSTRINSFKFSSCQ